jgi:hypothetical protein
MLWTSVVKFTLDFGAHHESFISVCCYLQSGNHIVHPLQDQTGGNQRVPDLGCEQDGEEQSIPFLLLPHVHKLV